MNNQQETLDLDDEDSQPFEWTIDEESEDEAAKQ